MHLCTQIPLKVVFPSVENLHVIPFPQCLLSKAEMTKVLVVVFPQILLAPSNHLMLMW